MNWKQRALGILQKGGLARPAFHLYETLRGFTGNSSEKVDLNSEPLAIPPARLRFKVAGDARASSFLDGGLKAATSLRSIVRNATDLELAACSPLLEFGCGCGRVLRHLCDVPGLHGCDYNRELTEWSARHLHFAQIAANSLTPPLPYPDAAFGLVYALSVFTHLPEPLQHAWIAELVRVLRPEGLLVFSTHGEFYAPELSGAEQALYREAKVVVRIPEGAGSNLCNAIHPPAWVRSRLCAGLEELAFQPEGALGNPRQDLWLFRKTSASLR